jgi:FkbM family methyltransferase
MIDTNFNRALKREVRLSARNFHTGNWDEAERGPEPAPIGLPTLRVIAAPVRRAIGRVYGFWAERIRPLAIDLVRLLWPSLEYRLKLKKHSGTYQGIGYLYDRLEDVTSKEMLVKLFAFRVMGHRKVRLPRNTADFWTDIRRIENLPIAGPPLPVEFMDIVLQLRDLRPIGFDMKAYCTGRGGSYVFLQRQYELHRGDTHCKAEPGDVVIDAGGCWGETALYFSHQVGEHGSVISYEFIPSNLRVLDRNLSENPDLAKRVRVVREPLWSSGGQTLYYVDWGPGSRVSFEKMRADFPDTRCSTTTIDSTVEEENLARLDFIKMDIEGAELNALKGGERTLKRFHPKLAISLYHSVDDFRTIPRYLDSLGLKYKFYLDHHTIYENETLLFCIPQK